MICKWADRQNHSLTQPKSPTSVECIRRTDGSHHTFNLRQLAILDCEGTGSSKACCRPMRPQPHSSTANRLPDRLLQHAHCAENITEKLMGEINGGHPLQRYAQPPWPCIDIQQDRVHDIKVSILQPLYPTAREHHTCGSMQCEIHCSRRQRCSDLY